MRERRPSDWRRDLAGRHPLEAEVAHALDAHPDLTLLRSLTASRTRLDFQLVGPGERLLEVELKSKRQPYPGCAKLRPDVPESELFILLTAVPTERRVLGRAEVTDYTRDSCSPSCS